MEKNGEVVTEVLDNGYVKRFFLHEIHCSGGSQYQPLGKESTLAMFNSSVMLDSEMSAIGAPAQKEKTVNITIGDLLEKMNITWESFALTWADLVTETEDK